MIYGYLVKVYRVTPLVIVLMACQHQVDAILVEERLHGGNHLVPQIPSSGTAGQNGLAQFVLNLRTEMSPSGKLITRKGARVLWLMNTNYQPSAHVASIK